MAKISPLSRIGELLSAPSLPPMLAGVSVSKCLDFDPSPPGLVSCFPLPHFTCISVLWGSSFACLLWPKCGQTSCDFPKHHFDKADVCIRILPDFGLGKLGESVDSIFKLPGGKVSNYPKTAFLSHLSQSPASGPEAKGKHIVMLILCLFTILIFCSLWTFSCINFNF